MRKYYSLKFQNSQRRQCDYDLLLIYVSKPDSSWFSAFLISLREFLNILILKACVVETHTLGYYSLALFMQNSNSICASLEKQKGF